MKEFVKLIQMVYVICPNSAPTARWRMTDKICS